ncbi:MAG: V-type ATP synthase subunit E [Thermoplasmata archaeon]|nr:V-type ATP synthase subunit E [Thermoplasmata archaeon]
MPLERLVEEIRSRAELELERERSRIEGEKAKITQDRDRRIEELKAEGARLAEIESARDRAQRIAAAKLQARKLEYEARERQTAGSLQQARQLLADFTNTPEYPQVLKRMFAVATDQLGKQVKVSGRAEDAAVLKTVAGKSFDPAPLSILGGMVVETADGSRRLNLTFDELTRLREDRVRALLSS